MMCALPLRISKYEVLGKLGAGGMAEVFLAEAVSAGVRQEVVIKRMLPSLAEDAQAAALFREEARLSCAIRHRNVVHVYELLDEGGLSLVMERLHGVSLDVVLARMREGDAALSAELAAHIVAEASAGVHAAHELTNAEGQPMALVHRDISPQNLFLTVDGTVKVLDFGIARARDRVVKTDTGLVRGKLQYMSPEQLSSLPVDRRTDVFALGIVLWESLTGRHLYPRKEPLAVIKAILEERPLPPSRLVDVPAELDAICLRALEHDPAVRYPTAAELRRDLVRFLSTRSTELFDEALAKVVRPIVEQRASKAKLESVEVSLDTAATPDETKVTGARAPPRRWAWAGAVTLVGVALLSAWLMGTRASQSELPRTPPPAELVVPPPAVAPVAAPTPPPPPSLTSLKVDSVPRGAQVLRGDVVLGVTPLETSWPPSGEVVLVVKADGYEPATTTVSSDVSSQVSVALVKRVVPKPRKEDPRKVKW
jgi:serine/threonine protein kinase